MFRILTWMTAFFSFKFKLGVEDVTEIERTVEIEKTVEIERMVEMQSHITVFYDIVKRVRRSVFHISSQSLHLLYVNARKRSFHKIKGFSIAFNKSFNLSVLNC